VLIFDGTLPAGSSKSCLQLLAFQNERIGLGLIIIGPTQIPIVAFASETGWV
jgi:hypothetical protein